MSSLWHLGQEALQGRQSGLLDSQRFGFQRAHRHRKPGLEHPQLIGQLSVDARLASAPAQGSSCLHVSNEKQRTGSFCSWMAECVTEYSLPAILACVRQCWPEHL